MMTSFPVLLYPVVAVLLSLCSGADPRLPFLSSDDTPTICDNALRYRAAAHDDGDTSAEADDVEESSTTSAAGHTVTISLNSTSYTPGQPLQVTVSNTAGVRGLLLYARRQGQLSPVGQFVTDAASVVDVRLVSCEGIDTDDTLVAWYSSSANNRSFTWNPPDKDIGALQFVGTVFADVGRYWPNVTSSSFRKGFTPIDMTGCGKTKGCFRYYTDAVHPNCDASTCDYVLTYNVTGDVANFEMSAAAGWVAVGFSSDDRMGGDDVFMCVRTRNGGAAVRNYVNEVSYMNPTLKKESHMSNEEWEVSGDVFGRHGRLSCRFSRPLKVMFDQKSVDLSNTWYQLYAWGTVSHSADAITRHALEKPPTSSHKITLRSARNEIVSGAAAATWRMPGVLPTLLLVVAAAAATRSV